MGWNVKTSIWRASERMFYANRYNRWDSLDKECKFYLIPPPGRPDNCEKKWKLKPWPTHRDYCPKCHERLLNELRPIPIRRNPSTGKFMYDYTLARLRWKCWISPYDIEPTVKTKHKKVINWDRIRKMFPNWESRKEVMKENLFRHGRGTKLED